MKNLLEYLNAMPIPEREPFCKRCGTTLAYLRKAISAGQSLGESLCINIERESSGAITVESLRDDVDWQYIRNSKAAA